MYAAVKLISKVIQGKCIGIHANTVSMTLGNDSFFNERVYEISTKKIAVCDT